MTSARRLCSALLLAAVPLLGACGVMRSVGLAENEPDPDAVRRPPGERVEPPHVVVRHVLISFADTRLAGVTRTRAEAERLAQNVLEMARGGRDMAELARLYSDDRHGTGEYSIANWGVTAEANEMDRERMARGFGHVAFALDPGGIGLVPYDEEDAPFGWHVIQRVR
jgi:hypothetical protein